MMDAGLPCCFTHRIDNFDKSFWSMHMWYRIVVVLRAVSKQHEAQPLRAVSKQHEAQRSRAHLDMREQISASWSCHRHSHA